MNGKSVRQRPSFDQRHASRTTALLFDISMLMAGDVDHFLPEFGWVTPQTDYHFLAQDLPRALRAATLGLTGDEHCNAVIASKLSDVTADLNRIGRLAVDACAMRRAGLEPDYQPVQFPLFDHLWRELLHPLPDEVAYWRVAGPRGGLNRLKIAAHHLRRRFLGNFVSPSRRMDGFMLNSLLKSFAATDGRPIYDLRAHQFAWRREPTNLPNGLRTALGAFRGVFESQLKNNLDGPHGIIQSALVLATQAIADHFAQGWNFLDHLIHRNPVGRMSDVMVSGTPKFYGRLLGYHYKNKGHKVWRFAHGGDRAFFNDPNFGLAEFPYCDRYYCHSPGEANNLRRRVADDRTITIGAENIEFLPCNSPRHRHIADHSPTPPSGTEKRIMYVPGAYLGERFIKPPNERCADVQYLDWQVWLLKQLKGAGYKTTVKVHPRGVFGSMNLLEPYCDATEMGFFDPTSYEVDAYVFDFAGSAFYEAMLSKAGVVYCDMGLRRIDIEAQDDLTARCTVVSCHLDERGRFRADDGELQNAVVTAFHFDPSASDFQSHYVTP